MKKVYAYPSVSKAYQTVLGLLFLLGLTTNVFGQTMPATQSLPYAQDFSSLTGTAPVYPAGWQCWQVAASAPSSAGRTGIPTLDRTIAVGTAASTGSGAYDFTGKIGFLSVGSSDCAMALALNTTGGSNINLTFDFMTIRNPYDGVTSTHLEAMVLQYRVGTTDVFTPLSYTPAEYAQNTTAQTSGTTGQQIVTGMKAVLPAACENQPVVQVRWILKTTFTGIGSRPSFAIDNVSVASAAQTNFNYNGSGDLASTGSWSPTPPNFTNDNQIFNIINTTSISTGTTWAVSGSGSKVVLGSAGGAPITMTLTAGASLSIASGMDVSLPSGGRHKLVYQNANAVSININNDPNLELVFDGATLTSSTTKNYGNVSLINNATVDMNNAAIGVQNLTVDAGSTFIGSSLSTRWVAVNSGGNVTINGTFKTAKAAGGLSSANVGTPASTFGAIQFIGAENLALGANSTIEYNRASSSTTQAISARTDYKNLTISGLDNVKAFDAGATTISGTLTVNMTQTLGRYLTLGGTTTVGTLTLTDGRVLLGANNLTANAVTGSLNGYVVTDAAGTLSVNNVTTATLFPIGNSVTSYTPATITNTGTADKFSINVATGTPCNANATRSVNRVWTITEAVVGGSVANIALQWNSADENTAFTRSLCAAVRCNGTNMVDRNGTNEAASGTDPYTKSINNNSNLGAFGVTSDITVIPIELSKFEAKATAKTTQLTWATASERNNALFQVEQSTDGTDFQTIGQVKGHGTTNTPQVYAYEHNTPSVGVNYYRLKQIDANGAFTYSPIRSVAFGKNVFVIKNTLVHNTLNIITNDEAATPLSIFNIAGQQVWSGKAQGTQQIEVSALPAGLYILRTATGATGRFVKE